MRVALSQPSGSWWSELRRGIEGFPVIPCQRQSAHAVSVRHCERSEAIHFAIRWLFGDLIPPTSVPCKPHGLLCCARNDDHCVIFNKGQAVILRLPR
jgi:hypothetical protein